MHKSIFVLRLKAKGSLGSSIMVVNLILLSFYESKVNVWVPFYGLVDSRFWVFLVLESRSLEGVLVMLDFLCNHNQEVIVSANPQDNQV